MLVAFVSMNGGCFHGCVPVVLFVATVAYGS